MDRLRTACLFLFLAAVPREGLTQTAPKATPLPSLIVGRSVEGERPVVDGRVNESLWQRAEPFTAFIQQEPAEGDLATDRTEVRFLLDPQNLYVAVVCFDSNPDGILVSESRRDADLDDTDSIQILLDTFNDGQNAFIFGTNPFGIEYDGQAMGRRPGRPEQPRGIQSELGRRLDGSDANDRARLGGGVCHPAQDPPLQPRNGANLGRERPPQHPPQERAGVPVAGAARLIQYNKQASTFSSNIRLALLNRSGTGFFLVYNDRRDTSSFTFDELLGRSFIVKYTRLFDY